MVAFCCLKLTVETWESRRTWAQIDSLSFDSGAIMAGHKSHVSLILTCKLDAYRIRKVNAINHDKAVVIKLLVRWQLLFAILPCCR